MNESPAQRFEDKTLQPAPVSRWRNCLNFLHWREDLGLLAVYALLVVVLSALSPYFFSVRNFRNILAAASIIGTISVAATMVIVSGGIDLSIGSVAAIAGVIVAQLSLHAPMELSVFAAVAVGAAIGLLNGALITLARINPLIATLGTLSIFHGLAFAFSGGLTQTIGSQGFGFIGRGFILGIPFSVMLMGLLFALVGGVMGWTVFGRSVYAIGGNVHVSRLAGLPVQRVQITVYVLSGMSAALGGVVLASQLGAAAPQAATGYELSVIAAVILGGASLSGGKGTVWGTLIGVLIMGTLNNGLTLLGVSSYYQDVARGGVLLLAVGLDQLRLHFSAKA